MKPPAPATKILFCMEAMRVPEGSWQCNSIFHRHAKITVDSTKQPLVWKHQTAHADPGFAVCEWNNSPASKKNARRRFDVTGVAQSKLVSTRPASGES